MKEQSPVGRIWELGKNEHGRLTAAVILAVIGVACGMTPYFAAAMLLSTAIRSVAAVIVTFISNIGVSLLGYINFICLTIAFFAGIEVCAAIRAGVIISHYCCTSSTPNVSAISGRAAPALYCSSKCFLSS